MYRLAEDCIYDRREISRIGTVVSVKDQSDLGCARAGGSTDETKSIVKNTLDILVSLTWHLDFQTFSGNIQACRKSCGA